MDFLLDFKIVYADKIHIIFDIGLEIRFLWAKE